MKKILSVILGLFLFCGGAHAQSLLLTYEGNPIENGSELTYVSTHYHSPAEVSLIVTNGSSDGKDVKVKRTDLDLITNTEASMCWGTSCYPPFIYETPDAVRMDAGASNSSFRGDYSHIGNIGTSRILFTFFDVNNPSDSTWLIINYEVLTAANFSFEVTHEGTDIVNDQEFSLLFDPTIDTAKFSAMVKNINVASVWVRMKKYDMSLLSGTNSNINFGLVQYPSNITNTTFSVPLEKEVSNSTFSGNYNHSGIQGTSKVRYTFYNSDNPNDSLSFVVNYKVGYLGTNEFTVNSSELSNAYPNPAATSLNFDYKLASANDNARIRINNLLGTAVRDIPLEKAEGKVTLDVTNLKNGIYFYSLITNNSTTITRKFVVKR